MQSRTALVLLDGMIDRLCRDVPDAVVNQALFEESALTHLIGPKTGWDGCLHELLGARLMPTSASGFVRVNFGPNGSHGLMLARASLEVLYDFFGSKIFAFDNVTLLSAYRRIATWPLQDFVSNAKYWISFPMARMLRGGSPYFDPSLTSLPPDPPMSFCRRSTRTPGFGSSLLYEGALKRLLKNRLTSFCFKNLSLAQSLLQGVKRGAEVVPPSFVHETMVSHRDILTKCPRYDWAYWDELHGSYLPRYFSHMRHLDLRLFEASNSSSFESTRSSGGAREFLRKELAGVSKASYPLPPEHELLLMYEYRPGEVREIRGGAPKPTFTDIRQRLVLNGLRNPVPSLPSRDFIDRDPGLINRRTEFFETAARTLELFDDPDPGVVLRGSQPLGDDVMVQAVLEPLKVRLITKGESWKYWFSRFYQKYLWDDLQRHPQFVATGRPLFTTDFIGLVARESALGLHLPLWVSGDYSKATDRLKIGYSREAFEASLQASHTPSDLRELLRGVLYEQTLHYPLREKLDPVKQSNGQLMGSTLSFPILCILNLIAYWSALERYLGHDVPLDSLPVMINGDDILFRCDSRLYHLWLESVHEMGFELSAGKNYVHDRFFTMNSQGFFWNGASGTVPRRVPMFNVGLLLGQSKVTGRESTSLRPIWDLYNEVLRGAQDPVRAHHRFLHYHRDDIATLTNRGEYNLFISQSFGGLGFNPDPEVLARGGPSGSPTVFTSFQRRFGGFLKSRSRNSHVGQFSSVPIWRGLVSTSKTRTETRQVFHVGDYRSQDRYQPLRGNEQIAFDPAVSLRLPLAVSRLHGDRSGLIVRRPSRSTLKDFRSVKCLPVKPHRLLFDNHVVVEVRC